jgi:copper chaperone NosL
MKSESKIIICAASLVLILTFFFPLWKINLEAPQYPEGIGLEIWINKITGQNPNDLDNINGLNHYIGMKRIEPDSIAELKIMPFIIIFMILFGLVTGFTGKRFLVYSWIALFVVLAAIGLYDFYMWEYDYGHNLNPNAAIKIPGMAYQPPLIGSKLLLNFNAVSLPDISFYILVAVVGLTIIALVRDRKISKELSANAKIKVNSSKITATVSTVNS